MAGRLYKLVKLRQASLVRQFNIEILAIKDFTTKTFSMKVKL